MAFNISQAEKSFCSAILKIWVYSNKSIWPATQNNSENQKIQSMIDVASNLFQWIWCLITCIIPASSYLRITNFIPKNSYLISSGNSLQANTFLWQLQLTHKLATVFFEKKSSTIQEQQGAFKYSLGRKFSIHMTETYDRQKQLLLKYEEIIFLYYECISNLCLINTSFTNFVTFSIKLEHQQMD